MKDEIKSRTETDRWEYRHHVAVRIILWSCLLTLPLLGCKEKDSSQMAQGTNSVSADADNSAKNVRDRDDATVTPEDQSNSPADRDAGWGR